MPAKDDTTTGALGGDFQETHWSQILAARTDDPVRRRAALEPLVSGYLRPVYGFLRRRGKSREEAWDLTQAFFEEVVLGPDFLRRADPAKGRFRAFLLTALVHYVSSAQRKDRARKRAPKDRILHWEDLEARGLKEPCHRHTPEEAFVHGCAAQVLEDVLAEVETACRHDGRQQHWEVFRRTEIEPILNGAAAPTLAQVCAELRLPDVALASNMKVTVKRRFRQALRNHVRRSAGPAGDVEQELRDLMEALSSAGAEA